jgi:hypothetical protein
MSSRTVLTIGVVLLLLTAGCSGVNQPTASATDDGTDSPVATIDVAASADVSSPPDVAVVRLTVVSTAPEADLARSRVAENVSAMRAALRSIGVEDDHVRTTYFHIGEIYDSTPERREVVGYRAVHGFAIETDVDRAGEVIDTAVTNGADRIDGVEFTLSAETRRTARERALEDAMANARRDADVLANAGNLTVVGVRSVSTADVGFVPYETSAPDARGGSTVIEPGPVTVSVRVSVTYEAG